MVVLMDGLMDLSSPWSPRGMPTSSWKCSPSSLVNTAAADGIVVLDARHEMLLGRKPGGSAVWKASQPDSCHPYLLLKPQQTTLCRALSNLLKGRRTLDLQ